MGVGAEAQAARAHFLSQARACERMGSPFTAALCRALARTLDLTSETGRRALAWPGDPERDALALRLCAGLHALVLTGRDRVLAAAFPPRSASEAILAALLPATLRDHDGAVAAFLDHPPQTNEVGRAAVLLPGFLAVARRTGLPLRLWEIGSSAGLNLLFDRFRFRYGDAVWGNADASVTLSPELRRGPPPLDGRLVVAERTGSDLAPVDLRRPDEKLRLTAFVWPDQADRLQRMEAAIGLALRHRIRPKPMEALAAVRAMLDDRRDGAAAVLFHSVVWPYLPDPTRAGIVAAMRDAGAAASPDRPLAWLRMEPGSGGEAALALTLWPGGETLHLADADFHGRWIAWR